MASFDLFGALLSQRIIFKNSSDFDAFKSLYLKALESQFGLVRQSAARAFANGLVQLSNLVKSKEEEQALLAAQKAAVKKAKKDKKGDDDEDNDNGDRNASPAPSISSITKASKQLNYYSLPFIDSISLLCSVYVQGGAVTTRTKVGVVQTFTYLFMISPDSLVESNYFQISQKLLIDVLSNFNIRNNSYKSSMAIRHVHFLLNSVISDKILGEFSQINAVKMIVNEIVLKNSRAKFVKETLVGSLKCVNSLIISLGSAISSIGDLIETSLLKLLVHPSYTVKITTCLCIKSFVESSPSHLIPLLTLGLNYITRELGNDANQEKEKQSSQPLNDEILGYAYMTSILAGLTKKYPQYSSLELAARVFTTATSLLKSGGNVTTVSVQVQVGWLFISGLMALGPSFVKVHLSQLLLLWKSALHRPVSKEHQANEKSTLELNYLLHVRHCTLTSISSFLSLNSQLVTPDVARRITVMLQNVLSFSSSIPSKRFLDDDLSHRLDKSVSLEHYNLMVKRRVYQCYVYLSQYSSGNEGFPANILTTALATFADPERDSSSQLSTTIATATGAIDSIWEVADNHAYGLTSKINGYNVDELIIDNSAVAANQPNESVDETHWLSEHVWYDRLEQDIVTPIIESIEYDAERILLADDSLATTSQSVPISTSIVDLSINLFVTLLPLQTSKVQESILDQLRTYILATSQPKNNPSRSGRRDAVTINSIVTIFQVLKYSLSANNKAAESFKNPRVLKIFIDIIKYGLRDSNAVTRNIASQSLGILCSIGSSTMAAEVIKSLVDEIVANRDPNSRAGNALSLGYILKYVGGMFAGLHLKTILGVLVSLANDPHPTVHFWALEGLSITIENTGMNFMGYASTTLSTLNKLYLLESHSDETMSAASSNLDVELPTTRVIARCVCSLITLLGPDLQTSQKNMSIVLTLIELFELSNDNNVVLEANRCIQELTIFTKSVNLKSFAKRIHSDLLRKDNDLLRDSAIDGLYQLIRTINVFQIAGADLDKHIWLAFDLNPNNKTIRKFIEYWLDQSAVDNPFEWITRVQSVLMKSRDSFRPDRSNPQEQNQPALELGDEEGESFAASNDNPGSEGNEKGGNIFANEPLRWQTRALAIELLHKLLETLLKGKPLQEREKSPIISKIGDIIKIAFSGSTSFVLELRLLGLSLLDLILSQLQDIVDPDFREVSLLEQYQAQISSALTPAFSSDSSPELAYRAIKVCATFIGSGIIKDVGRMGRILKLLTTALESCSGPQITLGDLKIPSPNSQIMLRLAILSLWAELQVSSVNPGQEYLVDVVKPYVPILLPLWITALRDFARLRFEPTQSTGLSSTGSSTTPGSISSSIDQMYSSLSKSSILPTYQQSWLQLVDAIASLIEEDSEKVFNILHEKEKSSTSPSDDIKYSSEPAAFFFVLFGLCFEALVRPNQSLGVTASTSDQKLRVLLALKRILHRSVSGVAVYKDEILAETIDVLDRIVLTGGLEEQRAVVSIAHNVCLNHPGRAVEDDANSDVNSSNNEEEIPESVDQLFELFRVSMLPITTMFPFLSDSEIATTRPQKFIENDETAAFIKDCLEALVAMIQVFPKVIKVDLYACLLYVFEKLLEDDNCQKRVIPSLLVIHKQLLQMMMKTRESSNEDVQVIDQAIVTAFSKIITLLKNTKDTTEEGLSRRRNCLLSAVVTVTVCKDSLQTETSTISDFGELLVENLSLPALSTMVSGCTKTVLISTINTRIGKILAESSLPPLLSLLTAGHGYEDEEENKKPEVYIISKLVNDILSGFVLALSGPQGKCPFFLPPAAGLCPDPLLASLGFVARTRLTF